MGVLRKINMSSFPNNKRKLNELKDYTLVYDFTIHSNVVFKFINIFLKYLILLS